MLVQPVASHNNKSPWEHGIDAYESGESATALGCFKPLSEQGHVDAQKKLGSMYYEGNGATKDDKQSAHWFRKAANQGNADAQYCTGEMYCDGESVLQDLAMACVWFNVAATNGYLDINVMRLWKKERDKTLTRLTDSERRLALKLSKLCFKKPARCPEYSDD